MEAFKSYIAKQLVGKTLHFKCECTFPLDIIGVIESFTVHNNSELVFKVRSKTGKTLYIGSNWGKMMVEEII